MSSAVIRTLRLFAAMLLFVGVAACSSGSEAVSEQTRQPTGGPADLLPQPELDTVKLGFSASFVGNLPGHFASIEGVYEEYGLQVELFDFSGATPAAQALQAGQIDVADVSGGPIIASLATGSPLLHTLVLRHNATDLFVVSGDIQSGEDLKGERIAIADFGSGSHSAVLVALETVGVSADDVTMTQIGGAGDRLAALQSGAVAAAPLDSGQRAQLEAEGFNILVDLGEEGVAPVGYVRSGIAVRAEFAEEHPNTVLAIVAANLDARTRALADEETSIEVYSEYAELPREEASVQVREELAEPWLPTDGVPDQAAYENSKKVLLSIDPSLESVDVTGAYTTDFLKELYDLGWYEALGLESDSLG